MLDGAHFDTAPMIIESFSGRARRSTVLHVEERCNANASACVRLALSESSVRSNEQPYGDQRQKCFHEDGSPDEVTRHSAALKPCHSTSKIRLNAPARASSILTVRTSSLSHNCRVLAAAIAALGITERRKYRRSVALQRIERAAYPQNTGSGCKQKLCVRMISLTSRPLCLDPLPIVALCKKFRKIPTWAPNFNRESLAGKIGMNVHGYFNGRYVNMSGRNLSRTLSMLGHLATGIGVATTGVAT